MALADYAKAAGAKALVMCPLNDGTPVSHADLVAALKAMAPILRERGLIGLVEPLGFPISSLRTKRQAVDAIDEAVRRTSTSWCTTPSTTTSPARPSSFPTGPASSTSPASSTRPWRSTTMLDPHRVLVDGADRLENVAQIRDSVGARLRRPVQLRAVRAGGAGARRSGGGARASMARMTESDGARREPGCGGLRSEAE